MRTLGEAILHLLRTSPQTTLNVQSASTLDAPMHKERGRLEFDKFPSPSTFACGRLFLGLKR